jgi:uncharacterized membrane protein
MLPDPLHPAIVHFPIAIALLLPIAAALAALAVGMGGLERRSWALVVLLHAVGAGSAWWAEETGHEQEERVEKVVDHKWIEEHEEAAERLVPAFGATWIVTAAGLLGGRAGAFARVAGVAAAIALAFLAYPVGRSGGALVYEHGAASAYAEPPSPTPPGPQPPGHEH